MIIHPKYAWQIIAAGLATHQQQLDGVLQLEWRKTIRSQAPQQSVALEEGGRQGRRSKRRHRRRSRQGVTENSHTRELTYPHKALSHFS